MDLIPFTYGWSASRDGGTGLQREVLWKHIGNVVITDQDVTCECGINHSRRFRRGQVKSRLKSLFRTFRQFQGTSSTMEQGWNGRIKVVGDEITVKWMDLRGENLDVFLYKTVELQVLRVRGSLTDLETVVRSIRGRQNLEVKTSIAGSATFQNHRALTYLKIHPDENTVFILFRFSLYGHSVDYIELLLRAKGCDSWCTITRNRRRRAQSAN